MSDDRRALGAEGEGRAAQYLARRGYRIAARTVRAGGVEIDLAATLIGEIVTVVGTFDIVFADYGVEAPSAPIVVSVEDHGVVEIQLFLTR